MAFTSVKSADATYFGNKRVVYGTYDSTAVTGGDVETDLNRVDGFVPIASGAAVVADAPTVNETFPLVNAGGKVTLICTSGSAGQWIAWGV